MVFYLYRKSSGQVIAMSEKTFAVTDEFLSELSTNTKVDLAVPMIISDGVISQATADQVALFLVAEDRDAKRAGLKREKVSFEQNNVDKMFFVAALKVIIKEINELRVKASLNTLTAASVKQAIIAQIDLDAIAI